MSWAAAWLRAALIQGVIVVFLLLGYFNLFPMFRGADNPLWFYVAGLLQFPASLLFILAPRLIVNGFEFFALVVVLLQFLLVAVLIRKPWRRVRV